MRRKNDVPSITRNEIRAVNYHYSIKSSVFHETIIVYGDDKVKPEISLLNVIAEEDRVSSKLKQYYHAQ